jgi:hypothetical protein
VGSSNVGVADATGAIDTTVRAHRVISTSGGVIIIVTAGLGGNTVNCADAFGTCVLRVQSVDDPLVVSDTALGFDPTAVAPPPTLSADPAGPYTDGQQVVVHGAGFTPGAFLGVAQCAAGAEPAAETCDSSDEARFGRITADADGAFTHTVTVHTTVQSASGAIACGAPGACVVFVANVSDYQNERVSLPLEFVGVGVGAAEATRALAFTGAGSDTVPEAAIGFGLVLLGAVLVLLTRRRA